MNEYSFLKHYRSFKYKFIIKKVKYVKKILKKKIKNSSSAVRYFSSETGSTKITTEIAKRDPSTNIITGYTNCDCNC